MHTAVADVPALALVTALALVVMTAVVVAAVRPVTFRVPCSQCHELLW